MNLFPRLASLALAALFPVGLAVAQTPAVTPTASPEVSETDAVQVRLGEVRAEQATIDAPENTRPPGATPAEALTRHSMVQETITILQQHLDVFRDAERFRRRKDDDESNSGTWPGISGNPPYSVLAVDGLRDAVQSLVQQVRSSEARLAVIGKAVDDAESRRKKSDSDLRQANERLESTGAAPPPRDLWLRDLEKVKNRLAGATLASLAAQRRLTEDEVAFDRQRLAQLQSQLDGASKTISFQREDLDHALAPLVAKGAALNQEIQAARTRNESRQQTLQQARDAFRLAQESKADAQALTRLHAVLEVRREEAETSQLFIDILNDLVAANNAERTVWGFRYALSQQSSVVDIQRATQRMGPTVEQARAMRDYITKQIESVARQIADYENRILPGAKTAMDPALGHAVIDTLLERESYFVRAQRAVDHFLWLVARAKGTIEDTGDAKPVGERVKGRILEVPETMKRVWNYELFSAEDTIEVDGQKITGSRSITLGKVAVALFILIAGYFACRIIARLAQLFFVKRFGIDTNLANLTRRWVLFLMVCILLLIALSWVKIPLTTFAFLGGALAIGVGFGTQNLLKNFISGVMLLVERPVKVGDIIELGATRGRVNSIGIRSSVIRSADGIETIVPNSALLENNVTNWTYSSPHVRFAIRVGVAYGTNTRDVGKLLLSAADEHGKILKDPEPVVHFEDFGENALIFSLNYWLEVRPEIDTRVIASDLRHMIDQRFGEAGIVLAFPQRDIRVDTSKPLQIEVLGAPPIPPASPS